MISRKHLVRASALATALGPLALQPALAQAVSYPNKPVRMLVGFAAGGATDLFARLVAQQLSERLGQQFIVENRPGAGGTIAGAAVAKAPADGYTLGVISASHAINATLYRALPYDTLADFVPVGTIATATNVLVVHPSMPVNSVAEYIALAKSKPGTINLASAGTGSSSHLAGELFKSMAGINVLHVPYKGTGEALRDLISGQVESTVDAVSALLPHINSGALKALGVGDPKRMPKLPNVPTISEAGVPGYAVFAWVGLVAPVGTPNSIVQKLNVELATLLRSPDVEKKIDDLGARTYISSAEEFGGLIRTEVPKFARIIQSAGIPLQ
jgi:tripartite-type tricarboxylate transporter receptor subunit TctC